MTNATPTCTDPQNNDEVLYTSTNCRPDDALLLSLQVSVGTCMDQVDLSNERIYIGFETDDDDKRLPYNYVGGLGWYITKSQSLVACKAGYYCPLNETSNIRNILTKCDDGEFCPEQMSQPYNCTGGDICDGKTFTPIVGIILAPLLVVFLVVACIFSCFRKGKRLKKSELQSLEEHVNRSSIRFGQNFQGDTEPVAIKFENVSFYLKDGKNTQLLYDINGHFPPASLVALMGASGCGKTTFMCAIADRATYGTMTGTYSINGVTDPPSNQIGFVPQDDIVRGNLTVTENLHYNAELRLPNTTSKAAREKHINDCIDVLGLDKVRHNLVGTVEQRGISGGQRKRVNIGMELASMPSVLFMDEPTSGLDGAATVALSRCLDKLRQAGLTIVSVIHQPRQEVFNAFTHLLLLGDGGKQVYCGRREYIVPYLTEAGFTQPPMSNAADWMIDVCCGLETHTSGDAYESPRMLFERWQSVGRTTALSPGSKWHQGDAPIPEHLAPLTKRKTVGMCAQIAILTKRFFKERPPSSLLVSLVVLVCIAIFLNINPLISSDYSWGYNPSAIVAEQNSVILPIVVCMVHIPIYADQKVNLARELNSGGITPFAIFFSTTLWTWAAVFVQTFAFTIVAYILCRPLQGYWSVLFAYYGYFLWWVGIANWTSLAFRREVAVLICLFWPIFEPIYNGYIGDSGGSSAAEDFTVRELLNSNVLIWVSSGRWLFQWIYAAEIGEFPDEVRYIYAVNQTLFWRDIGGPDSNLPGKVTEAALFQFLSPWSIWPMYWITFLLLVMIRVSDLKKMQACRASCFTCSGGPCFFWLQFFGNLKVSGKTAKDLEHEAELAQDSYLHKDKASHDEGKKAGDTSGQRVNFGDV
jgi:ABC-type multidrug transport system ATPase subunit